MLMTRFPLQTRTPFAAAILLACVAGSTASAAAAEVQLRPKAVCSGSIVRLADVADISAVDPREATALGEITLSPGPAPGREIRIDVATVRSRLAVRGVNLAETRISGSSLVVVTSSAAVPTTGAGAGMPQSPSDVQRHRAEALVTQAVKAYLSRAGVDSAGVSISVTLNDADIPTVLGGMAAGYEVRGGSAPWDRPQRLSVRTLDRNQTVHEFAIDCRIVAHPFVLAVKQALPRGHIVQASDLVWRQSEQTEGAFTRAADLIGQETQRALRQEDIVRREHVRPAPLVRSNDIVTVSARSGAIVVKRPMKARSDGAMGETVTLVSLDGRQTVVARVTGYHEADVSTSDNGPSPVDETRIQFSNGRREPRVRASSAVSPAVMTVPPPDSSIPVLPARSPAPGVQP